MIPTLIFLLVVTVTPNIAAGRDGDPGPILAYGFKQVVTAHNNGPHGVLMDCKWGTDILFALVDPKFTTDHFGSKLKAYRIAFSTITSSENSFSIEGGPNNFDQKSSEAGKWIAVVSTKTGDIRAGTFVFSRSAINMPSTVTLKTNTGDGDIDFGEALWVAIVSTGSQDLIAVAFSDKIVRVYDHMDGWSTLTGADQIVTTPLLKTLFRVKHSNNDASFLKEVFAIDEPGILGVLEVESTSKISICTFENALSALSPTLNVQSATRCYDTTDDYDKVETRRIAKTKYFVIKKLDKVVVWNYLTGVAREDIYAHFSTYDKGLSYVRAYPGSIDQFVTFQDNIGLYRAGAKTFSSSTTITGYVFTERALCISEDGKMIAVGTGLNEGRRDHERLHIMKQNSGCHSTCDGVCTQLSNLAACLRCEPGKLLFEGVFCMSGTTCPIGSYPTLDDMNEACLKCPSGEYLSGTRTCGTTCPDGFYPFDFASGNYCKTCHTDCETCDGDTDTNCLTCNGLKYVKLPEKVCYAVCPAGTYGRADGRTKVCENCDSSCLECSGSATTCTKCDPLSDSYLYKHGSTCVDSCPDKTWLNISTSTCEACHPSCGNCSADGPTFCTTCPLNEFLKNGICVTDCGDGMAPVSLVCTDCTSPCKNCGGGSGNSCTSCIPDYFLMGLLCLAECFEGFYEDRGLYCAQCDRSCKTCNGGTNSNCLSCNRGDFLDGSSCSPTCSEGKTSNPTSKICETCSLGCASCIQSPTDCQGTCLSNYFQARNDCSPCDLSCSTCSSTLECLTCPKNYDLTLEKECRVLGIKADYSLNQIYHPESQADYVFNLEVSPPNKAGALLFNLFKPPTSQKQVFKITNSDTGEIYESYTEKDENNKLRVFVTQDPEAKTKTPLKSLTFEITDPALNENPNIVINDETPLTKSELKSYEKPASPEQILDAQTTGETLNTVNNVSEGATTAAATIASVIALDPTGIAIKFGQFLDLLKKFKYINIYKGELFEAQLNGAPEPKSSKSRILLEEGRDNLYDVQNGSKGKFNEFKLSLGLEGVTLIKALAYLISWLLKIICLGMISHMVKKRKIIVWALKMNKIQKKVHFLVFGITSTNSLFYASRVFLHRKLEPNLNSFIIKMFACMLITLITIDFIEIMSIISSMINQHFWLVTQKQDEKSKQNQEENEKHDQSSLSESMINLKPSEKTNSKAKSRLTPVLKKNQVQISNNDSDSNSPLKVQTGPKMKKKPKNSVLPWNTIVHKTLRKMKKVSQTRLELEKNPTKYFKNRPLKKVVDFDRTIAKAKKNTVIEEFLTSELKPLEVVLKQKFCLLSNYIFILRMGVYQVLICALPQAPKFQMVVLLVIELSYFLLTLVVFLKYKHLESTLGFISKIVQSISILAFFTVLTIIAFRNGSKIEPVPLMLQNTGIWVRILGLIMELFFTFLKIMSLIYFKCKNRKNKNSKSGKKQTSPLIIYMMIPDELPRIFPKPNKKKKIADNTFFNKNKSESKQGSMQTINGDGSVKKSKLRAVKRRRNKIRSKVLSNSKKLKTSEVGSTHRRNNSQKLKNQQKREKRKLNNIKEVTETNEGSKSNISEKSLENMKMKNLIQTSSLENQEEPNNKKTQEKKK